jgi:hypothetical protein
MPTPAPCVRLADDQRAAEPDFGGQPLGEPSAKEQTADEGLAAECGDSAVGTGSPMNGALPNVSLVRGMF